MLSINRIKVEILSDKSNDISDLYGFDYSFNTGLNIIAGQNSRGKTTINSCIYYALGMEELLGGKNDKALDKALKEEFTIISGADEIDHNIIISKVYLEIFNNKDVKTLLRHIKSQVKEEPNNIIKIFDSDIESISDNANEIERLYVNGRGNNENENGFYLWLADFVDLEIPTVSNTSKTDNFSPLYLQVIFSTFLIEQTKGWSDFFATMPFFGIPRAKEKNVEFLLGLNELKLSTKRDILIKEKNIIAEEWTGILNSLKLIEKEYNGFLSNLPEELTVDHSEIEKINISFKTPQNGNLSLDTHMTLLEEKYAEMEKAPISKVGNNKNALLVEYKEQKSQYYDLKTYIEDFIGKFHVEKYQQKNLYKQLKRIETEIKDHESLKKVFKSNILNEKGGHYCPVCTQSVSIDLIAEGSLEISKLGLDENTAFLKSQKKLLETSIKSLANTIEEKEVILKYLNKNLRQKEEVIKSLSKDLIADDRSFSEAYVVKKMQIQRQIDNLKFIQLEIAKHKDELINRANRFHNNLIKLNGLNASEAKDEELIKYFEIYYGNLLSNFGYESNPAWKINISRRQPFKYFPIYKNYVDDKTPQSIRINSSASDFVRNLWAYSISLLIKGKNHPGLLVFDEPGQHRINIQSLKSLFKFCSEITDRQIIIFTSTEKQINEKEILEIDKLVENIEKEKLHLIKLDEKMKVIQQL